MAYFKKPKKQVTAPIILRAVVVKKQVVKEDKPVIKVESLITRAKNCLKKLKTNHGVFKQAVPLEIGIAKEIYSQYPQYPHRVINSALYLHTHNIRYLNNLIKQDIRYSLKGEEITTIDASSKDVAKEVIQQIKTLKKGKKREVKSKAVKKQ